MSQSTSWLGRVRRPEYTGENRCVPCTVVNSVIACGVAGAVSVVSVPLGVMVLVVAATLIYLRGYLVPGTPTLTRRYAPDTVLRRFGKAPSDVALDPEAVLTTLDVAEPIDDRRDVKLTPEFRREWHERTSSRDSERAPETRVAALFGLDAADVTVTREDGSYAATFDGERVGHWASDAALRADEAVAEVLAERDSRWQHRDPTARAALLRGVRTLAETCSGCGGDVTLSTTTVESCCSTRDVFTVECTACGTPLAEVPA